MPIIGHAFIGVAVSHAIPAEAFRTDRNSTLEPYAWLPACVLLSYLPDIATQVGVLVGHHTAKVASHSMVLGVLCGAGIAVGWGRVTGSSVPKLSMLTIGLILLHDLTDLLQAADRMPLWPLSTAVMAPSWFALPNRVSSELLIFGMPWALYEWLRLSSRNAAVVSGKPRGHRALLWAGRALVVSLIGLGLLIQHLRADRQRHLARATELLQAGDVAEALRATGEADRWPRWLTGERGLAELIRGEAYERLGDLDNAERSFLRARAADPESFWAVADLAEFYASHGIARERIERSAPYVALLRGRFAGHENFRLVMERLHQAVRK